MLLSFKDQIHRKMMNQRFLLILPLFILFLFNGKKYEEAVIERLLVPVKVCLEGQDCGTITQTSQIMASVPAEIEKVELSEGSEHTIRMLNSGEGGQMIFEPAVIKVSKGDTVHFKATDMSHNSASIDGMLPEGALPWSGQMNTDISVTLETEGVYVYQCSPHLVLAMVGVIAVGEATNLEQIITDSKAIQQSFVMNQDRLETYLNTLN